MVSEIWRYVGKIGPDNYPTVDLRGAITQRPQRQLTRGLVCVKAQATGFHNHKSACGLSPGSLSYYCRSTIQGTDFSPGYNFSHPLASFGRMPFMDTEATTTKMTSRSRSAQQRHDASKSVRSRCFRHLARSIRRFFALTLVGSFSNSSFSFCHLSFPSFPLPVSCTVSLCTAVLADVARMSSFKSLLNSDDRTASCCSPSSCVPAFASRRSLRRLATGPSTDAETAQQTRCGTDRAHGPPFGAFGQVGLAVRPPQHAPGRRRRRCWPRAGAAVLLLGRGWAPPRTRPVLPLAVLVDQRFKVKSRCPALWAVRSAPVLCPPVD